jgi:methyl coenzyme M reductase subunit C
VVGLAVALAAAPGAALFTTPVPAVAVALGTALVAVALVAVALGTALGAVALAPRGSARAMEPAPSAEGGR